MYLDNWSSFGECQVNLSELFSYGRALMVPQKKHCLSRVLPVKKLTSKKKRGDGWRFKSKLSILPRGNRIWKGSRVWKSKAYLWELQVSTKTQALGRPVAGRWSSRDRKGRLTYKPPCTKGGRRTVLNFKQGRANNFSISDLTLKQCKFVSGKSVKMLFQ